MTPGTATGDPPFRRELSNHPQTLRGSFSAVSTAPIARQVTFCSIFRDLQDYYTFAPRKPHNSSEFRISLRFLIIFADLFANLAIRTDFDQIFSEFHIFLTNT